MRGLGQEYRVIPEEVTDEMNSTVRDIGGYILTAAKFIGGAAAIALLIRWVRNR